VAGAREPRRICPCLTGLPTTMQKLHGSSVDSMLGLFDHRAMDRERYALLLGRLICTLQSLEFALRTILVSATRRPGKREPPFDLAAMQYASLVPENPFTSYDTFGDLLAAFNAAPSLPPELKLDLSLADLHDTVVQGRLSAPIESTPLRLLKFGRPAGGLVRVTHCSDLSEAWLTAETERVVAEVAKVALAVEKMAGVR
jgi:hypothetical protein